MLRLNLRRLSVVKKFLRFVIRLKIMSSPSNPVFICEKEVVIKIPKLTKEFIEQMTNRGSPLVPKQLKSRLEKRERMCVLRKRSLKPECTETNPSKSKSVGQEVNNMTPVASVPVDPSHSAPSVKLVTRYIGRGSKNIPSRALKRRKLGLHKTVTSKQPTQKCLSSATSFSSESKVHEEETIPKPEVPKETKPKRRKMPKASPTSLVCSETLITVPSWEFKPVTSLYQMEGTEVEGTEDISDLVFQRRHLKAEQDERKRWDMILREQKVNKKLKYKNGRDAEKDSENNVQKKSQSFYPDPRHNESESESKEEEKKPVEEEEKVDKEKEDTPQSEEKISEEKSEETGVKRKTKEPNESADEVIAKNAKVEEEKEA